MVVITKVSPKKGSAGQNLSGRARAIFTRAVNLRGFPPGVPTGVGKNFCVFHRSVAGHRGPPSLQGGMAMGGQGVGPGAGAVPGGALPCWHVGRGSRNNFDSQ